MRIADYLGQHVSSILEEMPFKSWPVEKSFEFELEEPTIHYIFTKHGLELRCDRYDKISVIFLGSEEIFGFEENLFEIAFSAKRSQVLEHFGTPSKSGGRIDDAILGDHGAWDRFARAGYAIHVEYRTDSDRIKKITLIRNDVIP